MKKNYLYLEIDSQALLHNVEYFKKRNNKDLIPVIKANAYGHGYEVIFDILYNYGIKVFAVARLMEAEYLCKLFNDAEVKFIIFEEIEDLDIIKKSDNLIMTATSIEVLKRALEENIPPKKINLKLDFGFGRTGITASDLHELKHIFSTTKERFYSIQSHLFSADYDDTAEIVKKFDKIIDTLGANRFEIIHLQNTVGSLVNKSSYTTHLRMGVGMFGMQEGGYYDINIQKTFSLRVLVDSIKHIDNLKYINYDKKEALNLKPETKKIARIKIGYGDGFLSLNKDSHCLIKNKEYRILQVTMDSTFIEIDDYVEVGDEAELYYNQYKTEADTGMEIYKLMTVLSSLRIARIKK